METITLDTPRGRFAARSAGQPSAPAVLLLHGFPDDATTFDSLGQGLADAGYRALSPYLRGYAPSPLVGSLKLDNLASDLVAIADHVSPRQPVCLVGHDYGAQIGYVALAQAAARFKAVVALAGAHPAIINRNIRRHPRQWWMSRYIVLFQFGRIADRWFAANDFAQVDRLWQRWSPGFRADPQHIDHVKRTLAASMPAPVAMYREGGFDVPARTVDASLLYIAGSRDGCLLPALVAGQAGLFRDYEESLWPDVGHFPHLERPAETLKATLDWFKR